MKKYSAELISFGLLLCGIGLSWVSRVERGRGVLAGKGVL